MRFLLPILALTYIFAGYIYESDVPIIVLDGRVIERDSRKPLAPTRKFDGKFCPSCRNQSAAGAAPTANAEIVQ